MKIIINLILILSLFSQKEITLISNLNDYKKISNDEFSLSWEIPVISDRNRQFGHFNSDDQYQNLSDLISNPDHTVLTITFNKSDKSISSWSASGSDVMQFNRYLPLYWGGVVPINQSYQFVKLLISSNYEKEDIYGLLVAHKKDSETLSFFKSELKSANSNRMREKLIFWIGNIESESATEYLIELFSDEIYKQIREKIIFALHISNTDKAYNFIKDIVLSDNHAISTREKALFWYGQSKRTELSELVDLMGKLESQDLKEKCIFAISQKNSKEAEQFLYKIALSNESHNLREKAIFWYGQTRHTDLAGLFDLMKKLDSSDLKEKCIFAISQKNSKESSEFLYKLAISNESRNLREKAIFWLGNSNKQSIDYLKKIYIGITDGQIREKLIFALHQNGSDEAIDFMLKLLKSDVTETRVKKKIIFWLGQSKSKRAQDAISSIID